MRERFAHEADDNVDERSQVAESTGNYTVSQKNIPDIFDCNVKTNYQILIIFGTKIPDTTRHQTTI